MKYKTTGRTYFESVSDKDLNRIMKSKFNVRQCPECGSGVEVIVQLPLYGASKGIVRCLHCGREVRKTMSFSATLASEKYFATPITSRSLLRSIYSIARYWNKEALNGGVQQ